MVIVKLPTVHKKQKHYRRWHFFSYRLYGQHLGFGNHGKRLPEEAANGVVVVVCFCFNKLCPKNKGSLQLLSESGWCVACFLETLKSMLPQQDWDGVLASCP